MGLLAFSSRLFASIVIVWTVCSVSLFLVSERSGRNHLLREAHILSGVFLGSHRVTKTLTNVTYLGCDE